VNEGENLIASKRQGGAGIARIKSGVLVKIIKADGRESGQQRIIAQSIARPLTCCSTCSAVTSVAKAPANPLPLSFRAQTGA